MPFEKNKSARKQIFDVLTILILGVTFAFALSLATLYYFGPSGSYKAGNILLSPEVSESLSYYDPNPTGGKPNHFVFDKIELHYLDPKEREWKREKIALENYKRFFEIITSERSLLVVPETILSEFVHESPTTLTVMVKDESSRREGASGKMRVFQEMEILKEGDYYRIQIKDAREGENWAYFYHMGIYQKSLQILLEKGLK